MMKVNQLGVVDEQGAITVAVDIPGTLLFPTWTGRVWVDNEQAHLQAAIAKKAAAYESKTVQVRADCEHQITVVLGWTNARQINVTMGIYNPLLAPIMVETIAACIAESNRCEDLFAQGLDATPAWPSATSYDQAKETLV